MLRAQPPNMLQTMSNSQEIALISIYLHDQYDSNYTI